MNNFSELLLNINATIKDALLQIDNNEEKILFIVTENNKLVGSLSDGDIRRWILNDGSINEKVSEVCFKGTFYVNIGYDLEFVKEEILRLKIAIVPVVDSNKIIIEFLEWNQLFDIQIKRKFEEPLNIPVVIMAGGKGTRLDPFTRILPKPLIPVGDKTILEVIIDKFLNYDVNHFYVSVNHKAKIIKSYFEELNPSYTLTYLFEDKPLGTVGALKQLDGRFEAEIFLTNCDIIIDCDYTDVLKNHREKKYDISIVASIKQYKIPYGICEIENGGTLVCIKEKPEYNFLVNTGMYIINSELLKFIPENEFFHITHLIESIQKLGKRIGVYPISENSWIDTGEWAEYRNAIEKMKL